MNSPREGSVNDGIAKKLSTTYEEWKMKKIALVFIMLLFASPNSLSLKLTSV